MNFRTMFKIIIGKNFQVIKNKSSINERFLFACNELGYNCIKSKKELRKILGFDNKLKIISAKILSFYFRFRHA